VRADAGHDEEKELTASVSCLFRFENACSSAGMGYVVYIVRCADGSLYTGIATDAVRRLAEHNGLGTRGARYTAARRPVELVYLAAFEDRSSACKEEARIKRLTRAAKNALIAATTLVVPSVVSESVVSSSSFETLTRSET
jgi:putative endonuclease